MIRALFVSAILCLAVSCGYHISGHADLVPKSIRTIAIPAFGNLTVHYKLTDKLPEAVAREFIARTRYKIVTDPNTADAVLRGTVINYVSYPTIFDPISNRAAAVQFDVTLQASLVNRRTGEVIWQRPSFDMKELYEISTDPRAYFDESGVAIDRLCGATAQTIVSAILENF
ncbi:MAG: LptE family protein [Bryobacteraceae bacterium]